MPYIEHEIPHSAVGVWEIPNRKIAVPCYTSKSDAKSRQDTVDAELSALYSADRDCTHIYDHAGSSVIGYSKIPMWYMNKVKIDDDGYLLKTDKAIHYVCYRVERATPKNGYWYINGKITKPMSSTDVVCISCTDETGKENYLAYFRYVGTEKR